MNHNALALGAILLVASLFSLTGCPAEPFDVRDLPADVITTRSSTTALDSDSVTIMSWNIRGSAVRSDPEHLKKLVATIREFSPDVVMLQEVHRNTQAAGGQDQFEILAKSLGMNGCFGESLRVGINGTYGNAILSEGLITDSRRVVLPGGGEPRTILSCDSSWTDVTVPLMTTHLTAWDRANRRTRTRQTQAIEDLLESNASPLVVLGGDFNAALSSPEMVALSAGTFVRPVISDYVVTHPSTGRSYDHLLVGDGWKIDDGEIVRQGPSDHWPIVGTLRFVEEKQGE